MADQLDQLDQLDLDDLIALCYAAAHRLSRRGLLRILDLLRLDRLAARAGVKIDRAA